MGGEGGGGEEGKDGGGHEGADLRDIDLTFVLFRMRREG